VSKPIMSSTTIKWALPAAALAAAATVVLWRSGPAPDDAPVYFPDAEPAPPTRPVTPAADAAADDARALSPTEKLRELNAMSETFRNTTFLIAIRDSGFVCNQLLGVYGGVNDSMTWTATCSELLAYTVRITNGGELHIEPMLEHSDSIGPRIEQRFDEPQPTLPPRELPQR
jgi:hypothetical protein